MSDHGSVNDLDNEWIPSPRRVSIVFAGVRVANSSRVRVLRQHGFLPVYYFPAADVRTDLLVATDYTTRSAYKGTATYFDLTTSERTARFAVWTYPRSSPGSPDTSGYYGFDWHSMDAWYEEVERVYVHARDPFLRADAIRSDRHVRVEVEGGVVADTQRPVLLFETGLVTRYYIPSDDVDFDLLSPSDTFTLCPYKGRAGYFDFHGDTLRAKDIAWRYLNPLADVSAIAGHLAFWNERDDTRITVDGEAVVCLGHRDCPGGGEPLTPQREFWTMPPPRRAAARTYEVENRRANGRAEGPPADIMDMRVERAGGRADDWLEQA